MSGNSSASTSPTAATSCIPGVSITNPPHRVTSKERAVVVCLPRESAPTSEVFCASTPVRKLQRVDLPTPEDPTNTEAIPGKKKTCRESNEVGSLSEIANDLTSGN